ncbi:Uncharacterised protein [Shigella flexneri]|nr:hypothetical protein SF660363_3690 [Shigella flexneri 6603-63]SRN43869.1 Uncharacterised protein [Shigella flexneri]
MVFLTMSWLKYSALKSLSIHPNKKYVSIEQGTSAGNILLALLAMKSIKESLLIADFEIRYPDIEKNMITAMPPALSKPNRYGSGCPESA